MPPQIAMGELSRYFIDAIIVYTEELYQYVCATYDVTW